MAPKHHGRGRSPSPAHGFELLERVGTGRLSVRDALFHARSSSSRDAVTAQLRLMSTREVTHQERDLHTWVDKQPWRKLLPALYRFDCTKSGRGESYGTAEPAVHYAILLHEVLA